MALVAGTLVVDCVREKGIEAEADEVGLADLDSGLSYIPVAIVVTGTRVVLGLVAVPAHEVVEELPCDVHPLII